MTEFGPEIAVNGVRPEWVRDGDMVRATMTRCGFGYVETVASKILWGGVPTIRLKADHPYYLVSQGVEDGVDTPYAPAPPPHDESGAIEDGDSLAWSTLRYISEADPGGQSDQSLAHDMALIAKQVIAQHESEPVDEATELWGRMFAMPGATICVSEDGPWSKPLAILRAHIAKVRAERG